MFVPPRSCTTKLVSPMSEPALPPATSAVGLTPSSNGQWLTGPPEIQTEHLDAVVSRIGDHDPSRAVDRYALGTLKLSIATAPAAERQEVIAGVVKHLNAMVLKVGDQDVA